MNMCFHTHTHTHTRLFDDSLIAEGPHDWHFYDGVLEKTTQ